jgi:hypothetical protein
VARRRDDGGAAVAEDVEIAFELADRPLGLERRLLVGGEGKVELGLLQQERRVGEHVDVADMVAVMMRDRDVLDVGRLDADLGQLARQGLGARRRAERTGDGFSAMASG